MVCGVRVCVCVCVCMCVCVRESCGRHRVYLSVCVYLCLIFEYFR